MALPDELARALGDPAIAHLRGEVVVLGGDDGKTLDEAGAGEGLVGGDGADVIVAAEQAVEPAFDEVDDQGADLGADALGHADALSFEYASDGVTWMVDPGTYTYTKDPSMRDQFRSSSGHNTLVVEGQSQSQSKGPFSWAYVADATLEELTATAESVICRGAHNGYERLNPPVRHERCVELIKRSDRPASSYLLIEDRIITTGSYRYQLRLHLAPDCKPSISHGRCMVYHPNGPLLAVGIWLVDSRRAGTAISIAVEDGWVSPDYGRKVPAPVLVADLQGEGDQMIVTVLVPLDREAVVDLEGLARLATDHDVQYAA